MANNVTLSTLYLGNFADVDPNESNNEAEFETNLLGTYGSAGSPLASQKTDVRTDSTDDLLYENNHSTDDTWSYDLGAGPVVTDLDTYIQFRGPVTYTDGSSESDVNLLVAQMTNGDVFLLIADGQTKLSSKAIESIDIQTVSFDGSSAIFQSSFDGDEFVCFTPGTRILTPRGEVAVESLAPGDLVETLDQGAQPLVWVGMRRLTFPGSPESQKPIQFKAGCFGPGRPERDLMVSPQHRILCETPKGERLAIAKSVAALRGVRAMTGKRQITYHALLFARHQIIRANGLPVESFYPGRHGMGLITPKDRRQIVVRLPGLLDDPVAAYGRHARPVLTCRDAMASVRTGSLTVSARVSRQFGAMQQMRATPVA